MKLNKSGKCICFHMKLKIYKWKSYPSSLKRQDYYVKTSKLKAHDDTK